MVHVGSESAALQDKSEVLGGEKEAYKLMASMEGRRGVNTQTQALTELHGKVYAVLESLRKMETNGN